MAPLPPNSTPRFKVNYTVNGLEHDFQIRSAASPAAIGLIVDAFLIAITDALYQLTISTVEFAADGSNIFLPVTTGIEGNVYSTGASAPQDAMWFYGFIGRSTGGRKWHLNVFGARSLGTNYHFAPGENGDLDAGVVVLASATPDIVAIDGLEVNVYTYINAGVNAYWQREVRP